MRLAILMTNTDESAFAQRYPKDGEKFSDLLWLSRPHWVFKVFSVKDGEFPAHLDFDGFLITGSPASVHDGAEWITALEHYVRDIVEHKIPLFGACFGHQVIARALGGRVALNPQGWVLGRVETRFIEGEATVPLYAAHKEQVLDVPKGGRVTARTKGCPIAGFAIGTHVLTTQYHPEMTLEFVSALLEEFASEIGHETTRQAATTLTEPTDHQALSEWITAFFDGA